MCKTYPSLAVAALLAFAASTTLARTPACATCPGVMGAPALMFLAQKSVQDELKLNDEQVKKVRDAVGRQKEAFAKLKDTPKEERTAKVAALFQEDRKEARQIVSGEQAHRLRQIMLQQRGGLAFANPRVADKLGLSDEQKAQCKAIFETAQVTARKVWTQEPPVAREEALKAMKQLREDVQARTLALLTEEQQARWKEMTGAPFTGELHFHASCASCTGDRQ